MQFIDYYKVMGIADDASVDDIKKAYRKLARKYHPDVSKEKGAEEKFKALGEAYEVLKDPQKRADYDALKRYGASSGNEFSPPPGWDHLHASNGFGDHGQRVPSGFSEFFDAIFAARQGHSDFNTTSDVHFSSRDIHQRLEITLEEAHHGGNRILQFQPMANDPQGSTQRTVRVSIPKGIRAGQQIRVKGHGESGVRGAPPGDLYLRVEIASHRWFIADGRNLALVLPVAPWEAVLGAVVPVPTLDGAVKLTIPPNSKAGQKLRLTGKGLHGNPAGDLIVTLQVVVPAAHTDSERALFRALADGIQFNPRQRLES